MNVLIISVHPDDETLGCGGTILKHRDKGDKLFWLIATEAFEKQGYSREFIRDREKQIQETAQRYGITKVFKLGHPAAGLHLVDFSRLIADMSSVVNECRPEIVYTVNRSDIHTDHQIIARAVAGCTKSFRYPFIKRVLMYECISETEMAPALPENMFIPNAYSDISKYMGEKLEIMKIYKSELLDPPFPRSVENLKALARFRGSTAGVEYAEAFMLLKDLF